MNTVAPFLFLNFKSRGFPLRLAAIDNSIYQFIFIKKNYNSNYSKNLRIKRSTWPPCTRVHRCCAHAAACDEPRVRLYGRVQHHVRVPMVYTREWTCGRTCARIYVWNEVGY